MGKFCGNCGKPLEDGALFCGSCGAKVEVEAPVVPAAPPPVVTPEPTVSEVKVPAPAEIPVEAPAVPEPAVAPAPVEIPPQPAPVPEEIPVQPSEEAQPASGSETPKKKKHPLLVTLLILGIVLVLAGAALVTLYFTSPAYGVAQQVENGEYESALASYRADVEGNDLQGWILEFRLGDYAQTLQDDYMSGKITYENAFEVLSVLSSMELESGRNALISVACEEVKRISESFESGTLTYDSAMEALGNLDVLGLPEVSARIKETSLYNDAATVYENGLRYLTAKKYAEAIAALRSVPKASAVYADARIKLAQAYEAYASETVALAREYEEEGKATDGIPLLESAITLLLEDEAGASRQISSCLEAYESIALGYLDFLYHGAMYLEAIQYAQSLKYGAESSWIQGYPAKAQVRFVDTVSSNVGALLASEDYAEAKRVADDALAQLPDVQELKALVEYVVNSTPDYLVEVYKGYLVQGATYTTETGFTLDTYDASSSQVVYNISGGNYASMKFYIVHDPDGNMADGTFRLYCDGVLTVTRVVGHSAPASWHTVNVAGVSQLKFEWYSEANSVCMVEEITLK